MRPGLFAAALVGGLIAAGPVFAETAVRIGYPGVGADDRPFAYGDYVAVTHVKELVQAELKDQPDVTVSWTFFRGAGPALNESLAAGQLDFAAGLGDLPSIVGRSKGLQTKFLASAGSHDPIYLAVPPDSDVKTIDDLKGRKVAQFRGTNLQIATDRVLEAHGLTEKDIRFVSLDTNAATAALVSGNVEASFGGSEYIELEKKGVVKIIYSTKNDSPTLGRNSGLFVTEAFEQAHPDITAKVVKAFVKAARYAADETNRPAVVRDLGQIGITGRDLRGRLRRRAAGAPHLAGDRRVHRGPIQGSGCTGQGVRADQEGCRHRRMVRHQVSAAGIDGTAAGELLADLRRQGREEDRRRGRAVQGGGLR